MFIILLNHFLVLAIICWIYSIKHKNLVPFSFFTLPYNTDFSVSFILLIEIIVIKWRFSIVLWWSEPWYFFFRYNFLFYLYLLLLLGFLCTPSLSFPVSFFSLWCLGLLIQLDFWALDLQPGHPHVSLTPALRGALLPNLGWSTNRSVLSLNLLLLLDQNIPQ